MSTGWRQFGRRWLPGLCSSPMDITGTRQHWRTHARSRSRGQKLVPGVEALRSPQVSRSLWSPIWPTLAWWFFPPIASFEELLDALEGQVAAGTYRDGKFQLLPLEGDLAVVELHRQVIDNILGRRDPEEYLVYTRDPEEAVRWVDSGRAMAAFFLGTPDLGMVLKAAREGKTMPQKSTYFHPKPPSGMVLYRLERSQAS